MIELVRFGHGEPVTACGSPGRARVKPVSGRRIDRADDFRWTQTPTARRQVTGAFLVQ
jgi:hypothetical protein